QRTTSCCAAPGKRTRRIPGNNRHPRPGKSLAFSLCSRTSSQKAGPAMNDLFDSSAKGGQNRDRERRDDIRRAQRLDAQDRRVIAIHGAREHNLKNVDLDIPRDKLVVLTGLSGSGKSSLAFDTIYAEGQRRYVESLSAYARQFLEMMQKPDVDQIDGLSPAISIEQKTTSRNPRSTVGTVTEIYD